MVDFKKVNEAKKRGRRGEPMKVISQGPVEMVEQSLVDDKDPKAAAAVPVPPSVVPPPSSTELKLIARVDELVASANRAVIDSAEKAEKGADLAKYIRTCKAKLEEIRTGIVKPFNDTVKEVNARFKKHTTKLDEGRETIDRKVIDFKVEEERKNREAAEAARVAALVDMPGHELDTVVVPDAPVHQATRGDFSTASVMTRYDFEVVNIATVAAQRPDLIAVDAVLVREIINAAEESGRRDHDIPGIRVFPVNSLAVR